MTSYSGLSVWPLAFFKGANTLVFVVASSSLDGADVKVKSASNERLNSTRMRKANRVLLLNKIVK